MRRKGWFRIPGVQEGERTLAQQMKGLTPALAAAPGRSVLDLGCAEGLIALEFARAGARSVRALDCNMELLATARVMQAGLAKNQGRASVEFEAGNVADLVAAPGERYDLVLALAIVHKMRRPAALLKYIAQVCGELAVLRLPKGSRGEFTTKWYGIACDVNRELAGHGLTLEQQLPGPDGELVQYWRAAA